MKFAGRAWLKVLLHSAKHGACAVLGALVGTVHEGGGDVDVLDAVPIAHHAPSTLVLDFAMSVIDEWCRASSMSIVGVYFSNKLSNDKSVGPVPEQLLLRVKSFVDAAVLVDHERLETSPEGCFDVCRRDSGPQSRWSRPLRYAVESCCNAAALVAALERGQAKDVVDFDEHLDDMSLDWRNPTVVAAPGARDPDEVVEPLEDSAEEETKRDAAGGGADDEKEREAADGGATAIDDVD